jgi:hypothetical protein
MASCSGQLEALAERDIRRYWPSLRRGRKVRVQRINIKIAKYSAVASNGDLAAIDSIVNCKDSQKSLLMTIMQTDID